jgi:protein TonB
VAERAAQSLDLSEVVPAPDRHDGIMLAARGDEGLPSDAPVIPVQSPNWLDFVSATNRHDGLMPVARRDEGWPGGAPVVPVSAPPAMSRPVLPYSSEMKPIGWIGSCLLHAGLVAAIVLIRPSVRPPQPWPESPTSFHVIFEPPSPASGKRAPTAPRPAPAPPKPPAPQPERLAVAPAAVNPAPPRPERKPTPPPVVRHLPRHAAFRPPLRPRWSRNRPLTRAWPRQVFNPPPRSYAPRFPPQPPVYSPAPATMPPAAAGEQVAAMPPRPISYAAGNAPPDYPAEARERGWQGRVVLRVEVSAAGLPLDVRISASSGYAMLDQAAWRAVRSWRFVPALRGGVPVTGAVDVPVQFRLEN